MVKNAVLKVLTQCQHCWRSRLELPKGSNLSQCAGCQTAMYCSKECQRAAWPTHKPHCQSNSNWRARIAEVDQTGSFKNLQEFSWKHRPSVSEFGIHAFDLNVDVTRCLREVLLIKVRPNPKWGHDGGKRRVERAFIAKEISVVSLECFEKGVREDMKANLHAFHEEQRRVGFESGFMAVFCDVSTGVTSAFGVGFAREILNELKVGQMWKASLFHALNTEAVL